MKKATTVTIVALVVGLFGVAGYCGIFLDSTSSSNHWYMSITKTDNKIYALNGFEYGLGYLDRGGSGNALISGGFLYITLHTGSSSYDYGSSGLRQYVIDLSTYTGTYTYLYTYISGGTLTGHGGTGSVNMSVGPPPPFDGSAPGAGLDELER